MRSTWTIRSSAPTICERIARDGRLNCPICTMFSIRVSASRAVLAWIVEIDPSCPVFIACSMSNASSPRTSPMMMRSGRMRSALRSRSRCVTCALAFQVLRPGLQPDDVRLLQLQFGGVLDADDALVVVDQLAHGVEQRGLARAGAARDQHVQPAARGDAEQPRHARRSSCRSRPSPSRSSRWRENLRIEMHGLSIASGGKMTLTRLPSGSLASTIGLDSSIRRPTRAAIFCAIEAMCSASRKRIAVRSSLPRALDDRRWPGRSP